MESQKTDQEIRQLIRATWGMIASDALAAGITDREDAMEAICNHLSPEDQVLAELVYEEVLPEDMRDF